MILAMALGDKTLPTTYGDKLLTITGALRCRSWQWRSSFSAG